MKFKFLALGLLTTSLLPSCVDLDGGGYYSSGYGRSYGNVYESYETPSYSNSYNNGYGPSYGYGSNYYHNRTNEYYRASNNNHSSHCDDDERNEKIRLTKGNDGNHDTRPSGYHTPEWYKDRGYNLHKYTYKDEDGDVKHKAHSDNKKHH